MIKKKDLISIRDLGRDELKEIFDLAKKVKADRQAYRDKLAGKSLALVFQKPSNRTRVSFEAGMTQLGGHAIYLDESNIKFGYREAVKDIASTLSRYVDCIVARTFSHSELEELAKFSDVPVINGLSDLLHPCQALGDIFTIIEKCPDFKKVRFTYIGDGNNVLHSLILAVAEMGMNLTIATPRKYEPKKEILDYGRSKSNIEILDDPVRAIEGADVVYTDVWTSMGQEREKKRRLRKFKKFQLNPKLLSHAKKSCLVMHCLPAHRGEEITDSVIDSPNSVVFDQAENRLHVQKAILLLLIKEYK